MTSRDDQVEALLDKAETLLAAGDTGGAQAICAQALALFPNHPGALFVRGDAFQMQGNLPAAASAYRAAALARPDHAASWAALAVTAYEMLDLSEADRAMKRSIREDPTNPQAWWVRSLLREWRGDIAGADRALAHAAWLDAESYPLPPRLTADEIDRIVEDCLMEMPPMVREYLTNVVIVLEEVPSIEILTQFDPPASPLQLLGFFSGPTLMDRGEGFTPWSQLPANIILFRRNLQRHAFDRADLIKELRMTLWHEVGHFLGLDEHDLAARGLG